MEALIGPAIVAAFISALITVVGWYVGHESNRRLEVARRRERIKDVQTALRAEIRSHRPRLTLFKTGIADVEERIGASSDGTSFTPFVPREVESFVFDAIVAEIHILPTEVIDPIVYYYKQMATFGYSPKI